MAKKRKSHYATHISAGGVKTFAVFQGEPAYKSWRARLKTDKTGTRVLAQGKSRHGVLKAFKRRDEVA